MAPETSSNITMILPEVTSGEEGDVEEEEDVEEEGDVGEGGGVEEEEEGGGKDGEEEAGRIDELVISTAHCTINAHHCSLFQLICHCTCSYHTVM